MRLSVAILTRNEEKNLPEALESCAGVADEIVVLDTGSVDGTVAVAEAHPQVRLLHATFEHFSQAKSAALEATRGDWVLVLDADERVSPELSHKLAHLLRSGALAEMGGFRIRRQTRVLGRVMTSMGLATDYPLRLFRREGAGYNQRPVHEGIVLPAGAVVGQLEETLEHHTFRGIDQYLRKIDLYTTLELQEDTRALRPWHLVFSPPSTFLRQYVGRGGWRDGLPGLVWAGCTATGRLVKDVKVWIAQQEDPRRDRIED